MVEEVDRADVAVHGDDLHWDHRIFVVWRGEDAGGECDVFRDYVGAVEAAGVVVEGNMAEGGELFEELAGMSVAKSWVAVAVHRPESQRKLGKDYTGAAAEAEVGAGVEPSVVLAGNVAVVVAAVAVAFVANACSDRHSRSLRTMHFVPEEVSEVGGCSIAGCKRRGLLQLTAAGLGDGQQLQTSTQSSPEDLLEEDREEEVVEAD